MYCCCIQVNGVDIFTMNFTSDPFSRVYTYCHKVRVPVQCVQYLRVCAGRTFRDLNVHVVCQHK